MATDFGSPAVGVSPAAIRRLSAPHIPLMVVVTDVDGEKPEQSDSDSGESPKGILKNDNDNSDGPMNNAEGVSPSQTGTGTKQGKWKRICKTFIGLKGFNKKNKNPSKSDQSTSSKSEKSPTIAADRLSRSSSLHPNSGAHMGRRFSRISVSPARSISSQLSSAKSEGDFYLCDMGNMSEILTTDDIKQLGKHFPASAVGCPCILTFSSSNDGYSLHNLYRKMESIDSPVILAILDAEGRAFGAVLSDPLKISEHFYGSSDCFLFRCEPDSDSLEIFKWKEGGNYYFIHTEENFLRVGAGNGSCGLFIDDNLFHGRTEQCATFGSPPLVPEEDFEVQTVECWTFGHSI